MADEGSREKILRLFRCRREDFVSGEELSQALGVSRTAIWKQIKALRELGYAIDAVPSRGYRLVSSPDLLLPGEIQAGLGTRRIGREVVFFGETDSTNQRAYELGAGDAPDGTVVIAERQSSGKGRLGRRWASPPEVNLYTSVMLRPDIAPRHAPQLTFLSAVAVARAVAEISGLQPTVKWPNDVLLGGRKVAGLLNEMSAETDTVHFVVLGIGVNLNMAIDQFPPDLRYPATSLLLEKGEPVSRREFARLLYRHLDRLYDLYLTEGFPAIRKAWLAFFDLLDRPVTIDQQDHVLRGTVEGLDADGSLLVRPENGMLERVLAGDVRPLPAGEA